LTTEVETLIGELEIAVDRLRSLYEQYFMGIEKLEPTVPRKNVDRRIHMLRKEQIRNTALRFRFNMLLQRYNTYQTHWQRICRDMENGTYKRHVIRAQQRFGGKRPSLRPLSGTPVADTPDELAELDREFAPAQLLDDRDVELEEEPPTFVRRPPPSTRTPRPPPSSRTPPARRSDPSSVGSAPTPRPPRSSGRTMPTQMTARSPALPRRESDLPDERVRQLYSQYVEAKRRQNESTAAITYDAVARSLRESSDKLRRKHGKPVDFEVAVKDGRAILRPILK
jgi:hypothetical protein